MEILVILSHALCLQYVRSLCHLLEFMILTYLPSLEKSSCKYIKLIFFLTAPYRPSGMTDMIPFVPNMAFAPQAAGMNPVAAQQGEFKFSQSKSRVAISKPKILNYFIIN